MFLASLRRSDTHAVVLLERDHRKVERLFKEFEDAKASATRVRLARDICNELTVHAELEEKVLYPAALRAFGREDDKLIREAAVEHRTFKQLIEAINGTGAGDRLFEANVTVLMEYVKHHVREEEREMFPKLEGAKLDLEALGSRMIQERVRLQQEMDRRRRPPSRTKVSTPSLGPPEASDRSVIPRDGSAARKARAPANHAVRKSASKSPRSSGSGAKLRVGKRAGPGANRGPRAADKGARRPAR